MGLTGEVSRPQNAGRLERRVRPKAQNESDRTGHGLQKTELPVLAAQGLEAKNA